MKFELKNNVIEIINKTQNWLIYYKENHDVQDLDLTFSYRFDASYCYLDLNCCRNNKAQITISFDNDDSFYNLDFKKCKIDFLDLEVSTLSLLKNLNFTLKEVVEWILKNHDVKTLEKEISDLNTNFCLAYE